MPSHFRRIDLPRCPVEVEHLERVVFFTGNYVNVVDGVTLTLHRLVETLESLGVEVVVVAPGGNNSELESARRLIQIPSLGLPIQKGYRISLGLHPGIISQIDDFAPQVVHVATPDLTGWMAVRYALRRQLPLTGTYHTNFASYLKYWGILPSAFTSLAWYMTKRFYSPFDQVFVPTDSQGEELVERGVLQRYATLARGVDHDRFHHRQRSMAWRLRFGVGINETVVLFCARLVWEKGLRTLVRSLDHLRQAGPPHRVVIVGDGDQKGWLQKRLPDAVFTGYLTGQELAQAYASCDLFVYPSTTDTFGNVTLEAMASGLPVVGARAPGTRTLVVHGQSGLLVDPDDPKALAEASAGLLSNEGRRRQLAAGAARRARQYCWPDIIAGFISDLDQLAGEAQRTAR